jgi:hypothetical protein
VRPRGAVARRRARRGFWPPSPARFPAPPEGVGRSPSTSSAELLISRLRAISSMRFAVRPSERPRDERAPPPPRAREARRSRRSRPAPQLRLDAGADPRSSRTRPARTSIATEAGEERTSSAARAYARTAKRARACGSSSAANRESLSAISAFVGSISSSILSTTTGQGYTARRRSDCVPDKRGVLRSPPWGGLGSIRHHFSAVDPRDSLRAGGREAPHRTRFVPAGQRVVREGMPRAIWSGKHLRRARQRAREDVQRDRRSTTWSSTSCTRRTARASATRGCARRRARRPRPGRRGTGRAAGRCSRALRASVEAARLVGRQQARQLEGQASAAPGARVEPPRAAASVRGEPERTARSLFRRLAFGGTHSVT